MPIPKLGTVEIADTSGLMLVRSSAVAPALRALCNIAASSTGALSASGAGTPLIGAVALVGFFLIGVSILRFDTALMRLATQENHAERRYAARLLDFIGNISAVASLRLQDATRRLLDTLLLSIFDPLKRSIVLTEWKWCSVDLLTALLRWSLVVAYAWSASRSAAAAGSTLLIGSLFMIHQYAQHAAGVLVSMAANYQGLARTQADFASADLIHQAPTVAPLPGSLPGDWQCIELRGLESSMPARNVAACAM